MERLPSSKNDKNFISNPGSKCRKNEQSDLAVQHKNLNNILLIGFHV